MKKILFSLMGLCFAGIIAAQEKPVRSNEVRELRIPIPGANKAGKEIAVKPANPAVYSETALTDPVLMITDYDCQTNASNQNRLYIFPDGTMAATANMSHAGTNWFSDRGSGYNYYNGTSWGAQPAARIESSLAGWPSYAPLGVNGEIVVSHHWSQGLFIMRSAQKGQGVWTESILDGPSGMADIEWGRVVTNGPDNTYVHIICSTFGAYAGLLGAVLYYRSLDGGVNWDINGVILPGMTSAQYLGFDGDTYTWAEPKGNTLCFVVGNSWNDQFIMKSTDNGTSWTKQIIWDCPYDLWNGGTSVPVFWCPDGASAIALDQNGKAHVTFGLTKASGDVAGNKYWEPFADGLLYWNEDMPPLPLNLDPVNLPANYIGWVQNPAVLTAPATELAWYFKSLSSFPTMVFDQDDNLYVIWSGVTISKDPDNYMVRHNFARGRYASTGTFNPQIIDLNRDVQYNNLECVYPSASPTTQNGKISILFQCDNLAGTYIYGTGGAQGQILITQNDIVYMEFAMSGILPVGIEGKEQKPIFQLGRNFPNPVKDETIINVSLEQTADLRLEIFSVVGEKMIEIEKGNISPGNYKFQIDATSFPSGFYFYTVTANQKSLSGKMVVSR